MLWGQLLAGLRTGLSQLKMAKSPSENEKYKTVKRRDAPFFVKLPAISPAVSLVLKQNWF
ncbi:hypothetical protein [Megasphaera stantonii]|uniref:hypothetical protein n=1 Tax=Megasphaera stantonii TaxID=2144175 RepID=UPI001D4C7EE1|nr:hypothetical protein [Megasphaera stantonii]HJE82673.1 hypothetical protein [Megasphaera stantonii]